MNKILQLRWSLISSQGEIFASIDNSVDWSGVRCFNWTANGTALETTYNINNSVDGVNKTFSIGLSHDAFAVGTTSFIQDQCMSTRIYDSTGTGVDNTFEEVLLTDRVSGSIFAVLLEEDVSGFDSKQHDFEMLVLKDSHTSNTLIPEYFFYVELE